jgi:hypothetical protein
VDSKSEITCEPEREYWLELATQNRDRLKNTHVSSLTYDRIVNFRRAIFEKAFSFTRDQLGGDINALSVFKEDKLIIAAGHQPSIYHCGVARKNVYLAESVSSGQMLGINIIIDTDAGIAARLCYPKISTTDAYHIGEALLSEGGDVYLSQHILEASQLKTVFAQVKADTIAAYRPAIDRLEEQYLEVAGVPVVIAQARVRRHFEYKPGYLELPLTELVSLSEATEFLSAIISEAAIFHEHFNLQLNAFRAERKIKNHANPFPNLEQRDGLIELPFWVIDRRSGVRAALYLNVKEGTLQSETGVNLGHQSQAMALFNWSGNEQFCLAPRALLITALLRLMSSDYFIHGLGGARYDAFLDRLFESYWQISAPKFAVVSETRYLFPELVGNLIETEQLHSSAREIQFHLDSYIEKGIFPEDIALTLGNLWQERTRLKADLIELKRSGSPAATITQAMKTVDAEIKAMLTKYFLTRPLPSPVAIEALRWREFPFMYFTGA